MPAPMGGALATLVISAIFTLLLAAMVGVVLRLSSRRKRPGDDG